jgi:hypothetical protein
MSTNNPLGLIPSPASPPEVLALEPRRYEDAVEGPHPQISPTTYVHWTRPDGDEFIAPLANAETYERKGYTRGKDEDIPDLVAYHAEAAQKAPPKAAEPKPSTRKEASSG